MEQQTADDRSSSVAVARRRPLRAPLTAGAVVVVVGLLATAVLAGVVAGDTREDVDAQLERTATEIDVQVNRRLEATEAALLTMAAQVSTGVASPREIQWALSNTQVVERVPGLLAMVYARATSADGVPRVAPRAVHPLAPNVSVLGRNILQDPERRRAVEAARDSGDTAVTGVVTHADGDVDAILVMVPVFDGAHASITERREAFVGVMLAVVSPGELFADVARMPVVATVQDLGATTGPSTPSAAAVPLWTSGERIPEGATTHVIRFADRSWLLTVAPGDGFPVASASASIVVVAGVLLSALLGLVATLLVGRRERLERLVEVRTSELRRANEELERANRLRSQFITTVSHELRTPLTSVIGFVQTVRRLGADNPGAREEFLARAERNGLLLRRMIEELLDFGRLERGEMALDPTPTDVGRATADLVDDVRPALRDRQVLVRAERETWAAVDRDALERIVANLLSNAVQHAPGAGPIQLSVRRRGGHVEVMCCDRGPGFLERDIPVLFERFVRGSGVMGDGTGIGLALVHELAVAHGGDAELRNREGGGAEVVVRLPAMDAPDATDVAAGTHAGEREPAEVD